MEDNKIVEMVKKVREELKGKQHKIDINKNGKLDAQDFKHLRKMKEEPELEEGVAEGADKDTLTQAVNLYREFSKKYPHKIAVDKSAKAHDLDLNKLNNYIDHGKYRATAKSDQGVAEGFADDFLAMAREKNPNARIVTADQKKKETDELMKKRAASAKSAPKSGVPADKYPLGGYDPKSNRSYSEEIELDEANKRTLAAGDRVSHPVHGSGVLHMTALGGGNMVPKDSAIVKFSGEKKTVKIRDLKLKEEVESIDESNAKDKNIEVGHYVQTAAGVEGIVKKISSDGKKLTIWNRKRQADHNVHVSKAEKIKGIAKKQSMKEEVEMDKNYIVQDTSGEVVYSSLNESDARRTAEKLVIETGKRHFVSIAPEVEEVEEGWDDMLKAAKSRVDAPAQKTSTKTFHDVKKTSTGTVYTKQSDTEGMSKGTGEDAAKAAEPKVKRGRGRPAGSKSGARQAGSASKTDYRGFVDHALNLPTRK
jgi:hypothetical protein